ncbi:MAG: hypothetical protein RLO46_13360, partial [Pseudomonadales bacterium]
RVVGVLDKTAKHLRDVLVPAIADARRSWRRRTLWLSLGVFGSLLTLFLGWSITSDLWEGVRFTPIAGLDTTTQIILAVLALVVLAYLYLNLKSLAGRWVVRALSRDEALGRDRDAVVSAFRDNLRAWWRSPASSRPRGWTWRTRRQLDTVLAEADGFVQALNDRYASPSGPSGN